MASSIRYALMKSAKFFPQHYISQVINDLGNNVSFTPTVIYNNFEVFVINAIGYRVTRTVYEPGTVFREHTHPVDKIDAVLSGRFRMTTPRGEVTLEAGDLLAVPRGLVHRAEVVGDEAVVSLDATRG